MPPRYPPRRLARMAITAEMEKLGMPDGVCVCCRKEGLEKSGHVMNHLLPHIGKSRRRSTKDYYTCGSCGFILHENDRKTHSPGGNESSCIVAALQEFSNNPKKLLEKILGLWKKKDELTKHSTQWKAPSHSVPRSSERSSVPSPSGSASLDSEALVTRPISPVIAKVAATESSAASAQQCSPTVPDQIAHVALRFGNDSEGAAPHRNKDSELGDAASWELGGSMYKSLSGSTPPQTTLPGPSVTAGKLFTRPR
jgi:hypothetical protein